MQLVNLSVQVIQWVVLLYFFLVNITYLILSVVAFFNIRRYMNLRRLYNYREAFLYGLYKPVSVIIPAHNEGVTIVENITTMLKLNYPEYEVIVINDGSTDNTLEVLKEAFDLVEIELEPSYLTSHPELVAMLSSRKGKLMVVTRTHGGKAAALNTGVHFSRYPLVCNIDCDSILDRNALLIVARPFLEDKTVVATGGIIRVANDCEMEKGEISKVRFPKNWWARFQVIEYLRAFLMGRVGWDSFNSLFIISGAFGVFRKDILKASGGYSESSIGEDMELVVHIHRYMREQRLPYRVRFVPDPVCWTEAPVTTRILSLQRSRWHRGLTEVLFRHRTMLFNRKYGFLGIITYPYFFFIEMMGPVVELLGYLLIPLFFFLGILSIQFFIAFLMLAFLLGSIISLLSVLLEEISFRKYQNLYDLVMLIVFTMLETFIFRPLTVIWRIKGLYQFLRGSKQWGDMKREGLGSKALRSRPAK